MSANAGTPTVTSAAGLNSAPSKDKISFGMADDKLIPANVAPSKKPGQFCNRLLWTIKNEVLVAFDSQDHLKLLVIH